MWTLLKITFTMLALPTIAMILSYLINIIFNDTVIEILDQIIDWLDYILWSRITNLLLIMISTMLVIAIVKLILKLINWWNDKD